MDSTVATNGESEQDGAIIHLTESHQKEAQEILRKSIYKMKYWSG